MIFTTCLAFCVGLQAEPALHYPWPLGTSECAHSAPPHPVVGKYGQLEGLSGAGNVGSLHEAVDIHAEKGERVYAIDCGIVRRVQVGEGPDGGLWIDSEGDAGFKYLHLDSASLQFGLGETVHVGDYLGDVASQSFNVDHLHLGWVRGTPMDVGPAGGEHLWTETTYEDNPLPWLLACLPGGWDAEPQVTDGEVLRTIVDESGAVRILARLSDTCGPADVLEGAAVATTMPLGWTFSVQRHEGESVVDVRSWRAEFRGALQGVHASEIYWSYPKPNGVHVLSDGDPEVRRFLVDLTSVEWKPLLGRLVAADPWNPEPGEYLVSLELIDASGGHSVVLEGEPLQIAKP